MYLNSYTHTQIKKCHLETQSIAFWCLPKTPESSIGYNNHNLTHVLWVHIDANRIFQKHTARKVHITDSISSLLLWQRISGGHFLLVVPVVIAKCPQLTEILRARFSSLSYKTSLPGDSNIIILYVNLTQDIFTDKREDEVSALSNISVLRLNMSSVSCAQAGQCHAVHLSESRTEKKKKKRKNKDYLPISRIPL